MASIRKSARKAAKRAGKKAKAVLTRKKKRKPGKLMAATALGVAAVTAGVVAARKRRKAKAKPAS
ncbi:MAG TPA: hypothetical protein VFZ26_07050 [Gemmatimonadales bacterium]